jgi:PAS domain S-box-containing protein
MEKAKILVVEDEGVVAADIEESLRRMGYSVVGAAASAVSAIRKAVETEPDLVLMDIKLKGPVDGVDAASELHERLGIPVVYLTAHADAEILERAKKSSPLGYVLKPFDERSLRSAVEIALHKHPQEQRLIDNEKRLVMALRSVDEAVILTDHTGTITLMNRGAEALTGWKQAEATGKPVNKIFTSIHATRGSLMTDPLARVLREGVGIGLGDKRVVISKQGAETWIRGSAVPLRDEEGAVVGAAVIFHSADLDGAEQAGFARSHHASRMETVGRVAGRVAEDFGKTLNLIGNSGRNLLSRYAPDDPARAELEEVLAVVDRGIQLSDRLANYTRRRIPRPVTFDVNELIADMAGLIQCAAGDGIEVLNKLGVDSGQVNADRGHIEHVIMSLVTSAREAMHPGGKLTLESGCVEIRSDSHETDSLKPGYYTAVSLSHTGACDSGAQELPRDVVELVRLAGGGITVHAEPGRLTTFSIYLPSVN